MLAYFLAIAVAFVGVTLYLTAFLRPQIHRQDDFLWSGLALFYALILWFCAGRITGAVLLGQLAIVVIAIAFIWENRQLRQTITTNSQNSNQALEGFSILSLILSSFAKLPELTKRKAVKPVKQTSSPQTPIPANQTETEKIETGDSPNLEKSSEEKLEISDSAVSETSPPKSTAENEIVKSESATKSSSSDIEKEKTEVEETLEEISSAKESLEDMEEVLEEEIELDQPTKTQNNTNIQTEKEGENLSTPVDELKDNDSLMDEEKENQDQSNQIKKQENFFSKLWGRFSNLLPQKNKNKNINKDKDKLDLPPTVTESLVADLPDSDTFDEDVTANEVESAIANFQLDDNNGQEKKEDKTNQFIETEEYTDIVEEEAELTQEEALSPDENTSEYQIESSINDDDLVIDIDEIVVEEENIESQENQPSETKLNLNNDEESLEENETIEGKQDDSTSNIDLDNIDFDSTEVPAEDTIDSLTNLHGGDVDEEKENQDNLTNELDDLLAESEDILNDVDKSSDDKNQDSEESDSEFEEMLSNWEESEDKKEK